MKPTPTPAREAPVKLRCTLDGLVLHAEMRPELNALVAFDGEESFVMDAVEAHFYELVAATEDELLQLQRAYYRLLRPAADFRWLNN